MNTERLSARLKAELARNKAKSAVLGVMCLVAAYFWVPLLASWVRGDSAAESDVADSNGSQPQAVSNNVKVTETKTDQRKPLDWRKAVARLRDGSLRGSIESFSLTRNPFADLAIPDVMQALDDEEEPEEEEAKEEVEPPPGPPSFDELRLVLNGTMVGTRSRMASINGTTYQQGQEVTVGTSDEGRDEARPSTAEEIVVVMSIHADCVVVRYDGRLHKLDLEPLSMSQSRSVVISGPLLNDARE